MKKPHSINARVGMRSSGGPITGAGRTTCFPPVGHSVVASGLGSTAILAGLQPAWLFARRGRVATCIRNSHPYARNITPIPVTPGAAYFHTISLVCLPRPSVDIYGDRLGRRGHPVPVRTLIECAYREAVSPACHTDDRRSRSRSVVNRRLATGVVACITGAVPAAPKLTRRRMLVYRQ